MKPDSGPGILDVAAVVLSPVLAVVLTIVFLLGWWVQAAGQFLTRGKEKANDS
jgi:hypothetical protein